MKVIRRVAAGAATFLLTGTLLASGTTTTAQSAAPPTGPQLLVAAKAVASGTYTPAQLALVNSDPRIAGNIVIGGKATMTIVQTEGYDKAMDLKMQAELTPEDLADLSGVTATTAAAAGVRCGFKHTATGTTKSNVGIQLFDYTHSLYFCRGNKNIKTYSGRDGVFTRVNSLVGRVRAHVNDNYKSPINQSSRYSRMGGQIELCLAGDVGCYQQFNPWIQLKQYALSSVITYREATGGGFK